MEASSCNCFPAARHDARLAIMRGDAETQNGTRLGAFSARRQLARLLKDHRTAARKAPGDFVVARIGSLSKLSRIEAGKSPVSVPDVRAMAFLYGLDEVTTAQLVQLADHTSDSEWWEPYSAEAVVPDWFTNYMGLESYADRLLTYQETLVPGLLQTPAYHRAVFDSDPTADPATAERQVELRIKRQQTAFDKRSPLHVTAVLNEAVLVREVGGPAVMVEQREHLLELARRPHINIFVVPWTAGAHAAMKDRSPSWSMTTRTTRMSPTSRRAPEAGTCRGLTSCRCTARTSTTSAICPSCSRSTRNDDRPQQVDQGQCFRKQR